MEDRYDDLNRKTATMDSNSADELTSEVDGDKNISYEYDSNGNRTKKILPGDHVEYYDYDIEGRLAQFTDVNGGIETFGYDGDGNRLYRTIGYTLQAPSDSSGNGDNSGSSNGGHDNGNGKDKGNHYGQLMSDKPSPITGFWVFNELSNGNGNGNSNSGNNGNSSNDNNGNNGNSGNNGNNGKNSGNDNGNGKDNGNHNGNGKGDNGKHLGWYKKAQKPKLHGKSPNTTDNGTYEVTNYINDVNKENPQVLMTSDENGTYTSAYTYGLDRISKK